MNTLRAILSAVAVLGFVASAATTAAAASHKEAKAKDDKRQTVAVLYFDYTGKDPELFGLKKGLAAMLISELNDVNEVRFVERERIQAIMDELKLSSSKAVDKKTAARVGKLLGARYLVVGTYFGLMKKLRIDARLLEVETGKIVKSVGTTGSPDDFMALVGNLRDAIRKELVALMPMEFSTKRQPKLTKNPKTKNPTTAKKKRPKVQKKLALRFSKALDAKDKGDTKTAKAELAAIVKEEPEFQLASTELTKIR